MALEIDGLSYEDVRESLIRPDRLAAIWATQHLPVTQAFEVFAVDDVVREMTSQWEESALDAEGGNPDWERITREASVATVRAVIAALHHLDKQSATVVETA